MADKNTITNTAAETTEATEVAEVTEKKSLGTKVKEGATKVWNVVKTPLIIGGSLLLGAGIALTGVAYERAMNNDYNPGFGPDPEDDPDEPIEGEYEEVQE